MSNNISGEPDRLYISKKDRDLYNNIIKQEAFFKKKGNLELFLFAMMFGYKNNAQLPIENRDGWVRTEYIGNEDKTIMDSIAVDTIGSSEILADRERVFEIAEEFAHGGIQLLVSEIKNTQFGSFQKRLEQKLFELYENIETQFI
jgi:hypothetical protein